MKHVFFVHGHITYYLAKSIQQYKQLLDADCLYLLARGYANDELTAPSNNFVQMAFSAKAINGLNFYKYWKYIGITDRKMQQLLNGSKYILYMPHFDNPVMQILATNKNCVEVNFMEEGSNCYSNQLFTSPVLQGKTKLNYFISRFFSLIGLYGFGRFIKVKALYNYKYIKNKFGNFYTISVAGFRHEKNKRVVVPLYKEKNFSYRPKFSDLLILEAGVEQGWMNREKFNEAVDYIFRENPGLRKVSVKFHPDQKERSLQEINAIFNKYGVETEIIPGKISIEQMLLDSQALTVYGFSSSVLLYALIMGHQIQSYEKYLRARDIQYKQYRELNDFSFEEIGEVIRSKTTKIYEVL